ncbi:MAG TPA: NfeD family protein [Gemmataceae bacterium]|nr:NfeD family protein [Gemmataceae bacterium]
MLHAACCIAIALLTPGSLPAEERRNAGLVAPIPSTITTEATSRLRSALYGPLRRYEDERNRNPKGVGDFYLVCDFNPDNHDNASDDFGACLTLADYLHDLRNKQGIQVIAYVHGKVTRHAVLPVLACSELILSNNPPAHLGKVAEADRPLKDWQRDPYIKLSNTRYPPVLIRKMFDSKVEVIKSRQGAYRDGNDKPRPKGATVAGLGAGETALYSFAQARDLGLCQPIARNSLDEVRQRYQLPSSSLYPPLDHLVAWRIVVSGPLDVPLKDKVKRRIADALGRKANLLILELACGDGESQAAHELGVFLTKLNDNRREPVETIAYVTNRARNTAAFLAFACNKIIMQREIKQDGQLVQEGARLGDFERYIQEHPTLETTLRDNLADIAKEKHYPALLARGMLDRDLRIVAVESTREESTRKFLSEADLKADQQGEQRWRSVGVVKPANPKEEGKYLTLTAAQARELGVAHEIVGSFDEVCELEGVKPSEVHTADSDWLDGLVDFLKDPWTSVILVMLGITCLILELKMPGVTLPGIISAICFLLFFWSHSQISGQIIWLAFLLFLLGLLLIGLEIFVIPGFGVTGISGIVLVVGSIGLVAYGHWPRSNEEWIDYGHALGPFTISLLGAMASAFILARYLPHIPYINRLMLRPQEESEFSESLSDSIRPEMAALLGAIGVAATPLRPAGKVQFGDDYVDVLAEGSYVLPGTRVQVVEIEGNRIVVKEV